MDFFVTNVTGEVHYDPPRRRQNKCISRQKESQRTSSTASPKPAKRQGGVTRVPMCTSRALGGDVNRDCRSERTGCEALFILFLGGFVALHLVRCQEGGGGGGSQMHTVHSQRKPSGEISRVRSRPWYEAK